MFDILAKFRSKSFNDIVCELGEANAKALQEYFSFLEVKDFIFWLDNDIDIDSLFPAITMRWDCPELISNMIIDINENVFNFENYFKKIKKLNCKHIQLRSFEVLSMDFWEYFIANFQYDGIDDIEIFTKFSSYLEVDKAKSLLKSNYRIKFIIFHSSPEYVFFKDSSEKNIFSYVSLFVDKIHSSQDCHVIDPAYFAVNIRLFTEAQEHHTYFNRKMGIDIDGNIKNCPSLSESFGNINDPDIDLRAIAQSPAFQRLWTVRKDDTAICRDCEFRYMCVDSREPHLGEDGLYHHKIPCPYDPYTATWHTQES